MSRSNQLPNLDKLFKDDDEQDFTPLGGSNLAAIFGTPQKSDGNSPSRPKKSSSDRDTQKSNTPQKTEVILAKAVHAYRLQNGQYSLVGKVGVALTGNPATRTYILILYRNKKEHISVVTLNAEFSYIIRENNYASWYDGNNENWSILFENTDSSVEFAREIGLSKYFLRGKLGETIFSQDLTMRNEGEGAKEGNNVSIRYSILTNIVQPSKIKEIPSQNMTVQISSDETWEKSLLGVNVGLRKLLVLPPSKQISLGPGFPRDKDIALDIEILEIVIPEKTISPHKPSIAGGKAALISRMAKMGQSILPKLTSSTTTDSEDTEEEVQIKSPRRNRNSHLSTSQLPKSPPNSNAPESMEESGPPTTVFTRNRTLPNASNMHGTIVPANSFPSAWTTTPIQQQYVSTVDGLFSVQQAVPQMMQVDPNINVFLSENRTHNAEIRMGMSKISDNVQKLLDKFHELEVQNASSPTNDKAFEKSLKMLLSLNIGKNYSNGNETAEAMNVGISDSKELIQSKEKLKILEEELNATKRSLDESNNRLLEMKTERIDFDKEKSEMRERIQRLESQLSDIQNSFQTSLMNISSVNEIASQHRNRNSKLETENVILKAEMKKIEKNTSQASSVDKVAEIKYIMNKIYQNLMEKFTEESYPTTFIQSTIANTIRAVTLQVLENGDTESRRSVAQMKEKNVIKSVEIPSKITTGDEVTLPELDGTPYTFDEPPPIPPMDLEIDSDWLL